MLLRGFVGSHHIHSLLLFFVRIHSLYLRFRFPLLSIIAVQKKNMKLFRTSVAVLPEEALVYILHAGVDSGRSTNRQKSTSD